MENCLFCKIIAGEIPATKMYEDNDMIIIKDIDPKAKNHFLCIPKSHFKLLADMTEEQSEQVRKCLKKIPTLEKELGLENGYRLVINQGDDAGQTVLHLHIHILSGQKMGWTPA
jgi:diadenosine tetraphosphate (Ap4A) HIT family hydrolase